MAGVASDRGIALDDPNAALRRQIIESASF
jgi:hypothetical protein